MPKQVVLWSTALIKVVFLKTLQEKGPRIEWIGPESSPQLFHI